jgi:NADP-dependent 3-hydroxy acid dehydrogenase YdfG
MRSDLTGRRIVVTGASSGIGAATCRAIVACGGSVAMLARRKERLDELHEELGERSIGIPCDVVDIDMLHVAVDAAASALGGLDGIVAAAGQSMVGSITTGDPEKWRQLMDLNLIGPLATARFAVPHFPDRGRRDVVLVGSSGALTPMPGVGIYASSKSGLQTACEVLRLELAPVGINVGHVVPGFFDTEILSGTIVFNGEAPLTPSPPMFIDGGSVQPPQVLADTITFMLAMPEGTAINEIVVRPTGQLAP